MIDQSVATIYNPEISICLLFHLIESPSSVTFRQGVHPSEFCHRFASTTQKPRPLKSTNHIVKFCLIEGLRAAAAGDRA
ncbi:unnamed protein product [Linum trigynum]|uniref:Uncharacterized protein n=1 Tax=Linum trigynum TaxID=586398 RepID=A0AAV2EJ87_9ROSI